MADTDGGRDAGRTPGGKTRVLVTVTLLGTVVLLSTGLYLQPARPLQVSVPAVQPAYKPGKHKAAGPDRGEPLEAAEGVPGRKGTHRSVADVGNTSSDISMCSFKARSDVIKKECANPRDPIRPYYYFTGRINKKYFNILVDDKHKLLFCSIPKAGCTSWKNYLVLMSDKGIKSGPIGKKVHNRNILRTYKLKFLSEYNQKEIQNRLKEYKKLVVVRHPFARLYSAYMNKYYDDVYDWRISRDIIKKFRKVDEKFTDAKVKKHQIYPTFEEFTKYVVSEYPNKFREAHWTKYQDLCYPCEINYEHVLKLETVATDTQILMSEPFMSDGKNLQLPNENPSSGSDKLVSAFSQLPDTLVRDLYNLYQEDFRMFGYTWDFKNNLPNCSYAEKQCC